MSSFFTGPAAQKKRKRPEHDRFNKPGKRRDVQGRRTVDTRAKQQRSSAQQENPRIRKPERAEISENEDDDLSGSASSSERDLDIAEAEGDVSSEEDETAAERRVRLAQRYLDKIKGEVDEFGFDAADLDRDIIARRLKQDNDEARGRQYRLIGTKLDLPRAQSTRFRADTLATTAVAVCKPFAYTVSKDKTLIKWQIPTPQALNTPSKRRGHDGVIRRPKQIAFVKGIKIRASEKSQHGHTAAILSVAASPDGKYVATGGADKKLIIWAADDLRPLKTFYTHRDAVTSLDFAPIIPGSSDFGAQLFSAGMDRSIKTYNFAGTDSLAYVETLFGHQDHVLGVSAVSQDLCVSVGARDRSARWWRVVDETQLKFLGDSSRSDEYQTGSIDCVAAIPPNHFVTGSDSGAIQLWSQHKKKSLFTVQTSHGVDPVPPLEDVTSEADPAVIDELKRSDTRQPRPRAITSLVALSGTDLVLSGSWDGWIRLWKVSDDKKTIVPLGQLGPASNGSLPSDGSMDNDKEIIDGIRTSTNDHGSIQGVVNGLAVFERRIETFNELGGSKEGDCKGICVIAGIGKELRFGRRLNLKNARNGAMVFEIPLLPTQHTNSAQ